MKKQKGHLIKTVKPDSIAEEMGIEPGDRLLAVSYTHLDVYKRQIEKQP